MSDDDDIDMQAAEYVLGTLDGDERASAAARRLTDAAFDAAVRAWEARLGPLNENAPGLAPPDHLRGAIMARIADDTARASISPLERRLRNWRFGAIAAGALAASVMLAAGLREFSRAPDQREFVAVLQKDAASPAFIVSVDLATRKLAIRAVAAEPQPDKSYQLWLVNAALGAPRSLGLVDQRGDVSRPSLAAYSPDAIEGATYAISLEPREGSPTGAPTGPVLYTGKLYLSNP